MSKIIFLSHIHEESKLAKIIQDAIEFEFSGFVDVFVSSDGKTIPAGANFLKRIEDGLINCVGALYMISPISVKRNWINFELGAVWIRNSISLKNNNPEIPTIPFCHSGITPSALPMPLLNLSAIKANNSSQLETAFKSIQNSVGGKGALKTDFDRLAKKIIDFEKEYTFGDSLVKLFQLIGINNSQVNQVITQCNRIGKNNMFQLKLGFRDKALIQELKKLESNNLKGFINIALQNAGLAFGTQGAINGGDATVNISTDMIIDFQALLLNSIK